jgi:RNA polymerase sigma factor (sigma-70 family)
MIAERTAAVFQTTHWTVVLQAANPESRTDNAAFAELYSAYWMPLYAYARRRGLTSAEAEDILQDFFTHLISKEALRGLQQEGGRFRSFLLKSLDNFLRNERRRGQAQKRGGGARVLSLNAQEGEARFALEAPDADTPESLFEKRWAFTLLEHTVGKLREEHSAAGRGEQFERLRPYLQGDRSGAPYSLVAAELGMTENAVKVAVHRMRARYGELLRQAIARTVSSPEEVDDELRYLIAIVGR